MASGNVPTRLTQAKRLLGFVGADRSGYRDDATQFLRLCSRSLLRHPPLPRCAVGVMSRHPSAPTPSAAPRTHHGPRPRPDTSAARHCSARGPRPAREQRTGFCTHRPPRNLRRPSPPTTIRPSPATPRLTNPAPTASFPHLQFPVHHDPAHLRALLAPPTRRRGPARSTRRLAARLGRSR